MRVVLRAFLIGTAVAGALAYAAAAALTVACAASETTFSLALGGMVLAAVERDGPDLVTTLGPGLAAVALLGGLLNAGACVVLLRRSRGGNRLT